MHQQARAASIKHMKILGIESSCDDTGVAVVEAHKDGTFKILSNIIASQDHVKTGGVVPEIAARHHASAIYPTVDQALEEAGITRKEIAAIGVTKGPGLMPCLLTGVEAARTISALNNIPIIGINHMAAHIASTFVEHPHMHFPAVALLVSGGHTMMVGMKKRDDYFLIGTTRDDAAGEAFDKVAKMLGLPYPGGPEISRVAEKGDPLKYHFPRPMINSGDFDFSFSGLKTAVLYHIRDNQPITEQDKADIAASFQESVVQVIMTKVRSAVREYNAKTVILGGGVSANTELRRRLKKVMGEERADIDVLVPSPGLFTDNGAMIAVAAGPRALKGDFDDWREIPVNPRLKLAE